MSVDLKNVVELICLVYHEARNVRHPVRKYLVDDAERYQKLIHLPTNRDKAWRQMRSIREKAINTGTVKEAAKVFEIHYALPLAEIVKLYEASFWTHSARRGGNAWASISARVLDLVSTMSALDTTGQGKVLYEQILEMSHNTGKVREKLAPFRLL